MSARYKNVSDRDNEKKLYLAARAGNVKEVRRLVYDHVVNVNFNVGSYKSTPLIEASRKNNHEIFHILMDAGAVISSDSLVGLIWNPKKLLGFFRHEAIGTGRKRERENDPNPIARPPASSRTL